MIYSPDYSSGGLLFRFSSFFFFFVMLNTIIIGAAMNNVKKNKYPVMNMICVVPDSSIISVYSFRFLLNYTSNIVEVQAWTF